MRLRIQSKSISKLAVLGEITDRARRRETVAVSHTVEDRFDVVGGSCGTMGGAFQNLADQERLDFGKIVD